MTKTARINYVHYIIFMRFAITPLFLLSLFPYTYINKYYIPHFSRQFSNMLFKGILAANIILRYRHPYNLISLDHCLSWNLFRLFSFWQGTACNLYTSYVAFPIVFRFPFSERNGLVPLGQSFFSLHDTSLLKITVIYYVYRVESVV